VFAYNILLERCKVIYPSIQYTLFTDRFYYLSDIFKYEINYANVNLPMLKSDTKTASRSRKRCVASVV